MSNEKEDESFRNWPLPPRSLDLRKCSDVPAEIMEECEQDSLGPAAVLRFCKRKVLIPYLRLLALTGLRKCPPRSFPQFRRNNGGLGSPCFGSPETDGSCCACFVSAVDSIYLMHILFLMILGHILQYMACFQQIGSFHSESGACGTFSVSIMANMIPALLQLAAHCHILWLFRVQEMEKLPNLMERVFLLSSGPELNGIARHHSLVRQIWILILAGAFWAIVSIAHLTWLISIENNFEIAFISSESPAWMSDILRVILIMGMGWQEVSKAVIITSYCIHAHLLSYYLKILRCSLICRSLSSLDWMREVTEFQGLLSHFNNDLSPSAVAVSGLAIAWAITGAMKLISTPLLHAVHSWTTTPLNIIYNTTHLVELSINSLEKANEAVLLHNSSSPTILPLQTLLSIDTMDVLSVVLKIVLAFASLIQAARVTSACRVLRDAGHAVRARPFAYRNAPPSPCLDSLLLYTSSLRLSATLLPCVRLPVTSSCLCFSIFLIVLIPAMLFIFIAVVHMYKIPQL